MAGNKIEGTYLGMDLGGTKLLIGETDAAGNILSYKKYPSGYLNQERALDFIQQSLDDYLREGRAKPGLPLLALGLGVVGRVDNAKGIWYQIDRKRNEQVNLGEALLQRYGLPCYVDNDVRSATKAELLFGHGRESKNFIYLNVGTGIAAGIVVNGRIVRGGHFNAGEVGHTTVGVNVGTKCDCGRHNCVETIVSGSGIDKCARLLAPDYPGTALVIPENGRVSVLEVFEKAGSDELCNRLTENAAEALANLIMNLVRTSDPETVVLGGGVVSDGYLFPLVQQKMNANTMRFVTGGVVLTELDPEFIGLLGACTVAMNNEFK